MGKFIKSFFLLVVISAIATTNVFAKKNSCIYSAVNLATAPPIVTTPVYLCLNSVASPLTATFLPGAIHNWYLTNSPTEIPTNTAPTPNTTTVSSTTYYVSQTIGIDESSRVPIVVNVVADTGGVLVPFCDIANTTPTSVAIDWNNVAGYLGYNYSYSIAGGPPVFGFQVSPSHFDVPVSGPGISVTFNILSVLGLPCVAPITITCHSTCTVAQSIAPNFPNIPTFCSGSPAPILDNTIVSPNGMTGTWSPALISNTANGSYVFTPDPILFPCALTQTLPVTVTPLVSPTFTTIPSTVCQNTIAPILPFSSSNLTPIVGTWNPTFVDTTILGAVTYTFTPNPGQCASATLTTVEITVVNPPNTLIAVDWTVTEAFAKNQIVTITATAAGNYLYQLDNGPFQESPIFEYVASGPHSITVKDFYGCNTPMTVNNVLVINYPKFFTPNGDAFNDTWNIFDLRNQIDSRIYIFDRFGKLLKELSPKGTGWDGTYTGHPMPADDYWFTVEYSEQGITKKFKSHFSLKR